MSISEQQSALVDPTAVSVGLSQVFTVTAASPNPAYLVLTALDHAEYTAGEAGATGNFFSNGHTLNLSAIGGDGRGAGIVFTLQPTGRYYNSTYGYLDQLTYNSSGTAEDVTNLSLFGTSDLRRSADLCRDAVQRNFTASVRPAAPVVVSGISVTAHAEQAWIDGQSVNLALPSNTSTDALGLKMMFVAHENAGPNVTPCLHFNSATDNFYMARCR